MIRQAISCDICGAEKRQTNHWFVGLESAGEIRISGWKSRNRTRPGAKHLCGQTCLHKLLDDFMARDVAAQGQRESAENQNTSLATPQTATQVRTDTSLTSNTAYDAAGLDSISSARLIPAAPVPAEILSSVAYISTEKTIPLEDIRSAAALSRHAEAWNRERERSRKHTLR